MIHPNGISINFNLPGQCMAQAQHHPSVGDWSSNFRFNRGDFAAALAEVDKFRLPQSILNNDGQVNLRVFNLANTMIT